MARLFISHSSANNDKAVEVRDWLAKNGWDDVFLDLDPERGIVAGQRWKEALQKAAYRCEVVLALVSKEWLASGWCKSEIDAARLIGKKVIAALVGVDKSAVPVDLTDEQFIDLTGDPQAYRRLKEGLKRAGLDPTTFPFPADRRPYPGFAYLEEQDAAVFFGRDAQIVRGLDEIRRLARAGVTRMLVILGASGSGKSSFLRAGLWPRLKRDDLEWLPLLIVRPERAAISGQYGLAEALYEAVSEPRFQDGVRQRGLPRSRVDIRDSIEKTDNGLAQLFAALRDIAQSGSSGDNAALPTILLAIDQGEELFNEEGRDEARRFIDILSKTLATDPRALAILVMRSDAFPLVQNEPALAALPKDTFTLDMMLQGSYRAVIEGPARLLDPPLAVDPQLVEVLLEDISGQDALPLLAFTLRHLYDNTRVDNALTLAGYDKIGRVKGVIAQAVEQAYAEAVAKGDAPKDKEERLKLARSAFIPHLAQVNPAGQFVRRVSPRDKIPSEARPLIDRFAEQRLLIRDRRQDAEVIEVAHEALLRQPPFSDWLGEDREFLLWRDRLTQARAAFAADERGLLAGRELTIARSYTQARAEREFETADLAFIRNSAEADDKRRAEEAEEQRKREASEKEEQERRIRDAERIAEEQKKAAAAQKRSTQAVFIGLIVALLVAAAAIWQYFEATKASRLAKEATAKAQASADEAKANLHDAQISQSHFLADLAGRKRTAEGDAGTAALLALEALPDGATATARPYVADAELQLDGAWRELRDRRILGYAGMVLSAAFSPDGKRIVTATTGWTARIWDVATGQPIGQPLRGHNADVWTAAFSPDGKRVVTASNDGTARLWDATTGRPIGQPLTGHEKAVERAAFSPDGHRIVTASDDTTARVWDAESGKPIGEPLRGHQSWVFSAAFSPDGARIVTASGDKTARLWDAATGRPIGQPLIGHGESVRDAEFSPDGKRVVTASADKSARMWDAATGQPIGEPLRGHQAWVLSAAFSPDGKRVVTASEDKTARLWDAATGQPIGEPLGGHNGALRSAAFSPDGKLIVTASMDGTARLWDATTGESIGESLRGHQDGVVSAAFSHDGKRIVTASQDKTARLWDAATGQPIGEPLAGHEEWVNSATFSPDDTRIVTASKDMTARLWDAATGQPIGEPLTGHQGWVLSAAFSPDGKRIVTASSDSTARVWDAETGEPIGAPLIGHGSTVRSAAFSPDGNRIVTTSEDGTARMWDAATGQPIGNPLRGHMGYLTNAAFSPDGTRIVTASHDATARLWDAATGQSIGEPLKGHQGWVLSAAFSPDGKRIVTASMDRTARLWDAATGQPIGELRGHDGAVRSAAFSPDGKRIVTASEDKTARLWDAPADTETLESRAKAAVPRCLTPSQRKDFFLQPEPPAWCIEMEKWPYNTPVWKRWLADVRAGNKPPLPAN
jgi:WD40 repeat protein